MSQTPLLSGVTFIKNGLKLGYPVLESILSLAPLCEEVIINVGYDDPHLEKDDGTYEYLKSNLTGPKYIFFKSYWDPALISGGQILAQQTNLALALAKGKYIHYIQADELLHEEDYGEIRKSLEVLEKHPELQGVVFQFTHFFGNTDTIKVARTNYRREIRIIRNFQGIKSWKDAQGFRTKDDTKLLCTLTPARILHYGWARKDQVMKVKVKAMDRLYHGDAAREEFAYKRIWGIRPYKQSHPKVMANWIQNQSNQMDLFSLPYHFKFHDIKLTLSQWIEDLTGHRLGEYKNYILKS